MLNKHTFCIESLISGNCDSLVALCFLTLSCTTLILALLALGGSHLEDLVRNRVCLAHGTLWNGDLVEAIHLDSG